jgi:hypothetical protein
MLFGGVGHGSLRDTWRSRRRDFRRTFQCLVRHQILEAGIGLASE